MSVQEIIAELPKLSEEERELILRQKSAPGSPHGLRGNLFRGSSGRFGHCIHRRR